MLTVVEIRALKPAKRPFKVADSDGLYLLVQPSGALLWRFRYRIVGTERKLSLGSFPDVSLQQARKLRDVALRSMVHSPPHERTGLLGFPSAGRGGKGPIRMYHHMRQPLLRASNGSDRLTGPGGRHRRACQLMAGGRLIRVSTHWAQAPGSSSLRRPMGDTRCAS
ncbi:MAG: Arm DNA-binding domain-containing protein [Sphingomonas sp.]|jgi:hypothetical protein|uniref:Arm DNA-binding domain-containing protein n=1 Tax=Sphingomonas sp. TaxID=28214 RepID=UPI0035615AAC